jgi:hypothetical protein
MMGFIKIQKEVYIGLRLVIFGVFLPFLTKSLAPLKRKIKSLAPFKNLKVQRSSFRIRNLFFGFSSSTIQNGDFELRF